MLTPETYTYALASGSRRLSGLTFASQRVERIAKFQQQNTQDDEYPKSIFYINIRGMIGGQGDKIRLVVTAMIHERQRYYYVVESGKDESTHEVPSEGEWVRCTHRLPVLFCEFGEGRQERAVAPYGESAAT